MRDEIRVLLAAGGGVTTRRRVLGAVPHHVLDHALRAGHLVRLHRGVYTDPQRQHEDRVALLAALAYAGPVAALSHVTGLHVWVPSVPLSTPLHVVVREETRPRGDARVLVHRWRDLRDEPPLVVRRGGLPVVRLERCLVDAWPLLPAGPDRRAPLLDAVGSRRTAVPRVRAALDAVPRLRDRQELRALLTLLASGCRSELELWGQERVFTGRAFAGAERQHRLVLEDRVVYLDLAFPDVGVAVELDGAAWHGSPEQRERDLRRDAALAALGWVVLRFSSRRLHAEPDAVRRQVLQVLAERRRVRSAA